VSVAAARVLDVHAPRDGDDEAVDGVARAAERLAGQVGVEARVARERVAHAPVVFVFVVVVGWGGKCASIGAELQNADRTGTSQLPGGRGQTRGQTVSVSSGS